METAMLIYDGECPVCNAYARHLQVAESGIMLELVNAREHPEMVSALKAQGFDLNRGMVLKLGGNIYFGRNCLQRLALIGRLDRFNAFHSLLSRPWLAAIVYPVLVLGRRVLLRLLGISLISIPETKERP